MILQSAKDMDTAFVSRVLTEHRLEPKPNAGFNAEPTYWQETGRWRRVIERYPWGAVIFMLDRQSERAATVVAIGKVDIDKGRVSTQGGSHPISIAWYQEMAMELKSAPSPDRLEIPGCLGFRQSDHICDGGLNRQTRKVEPACVWRTRCIALQEYAIKEGRFQEQILQGKSPAQVVQLTTRLLERGGQTDPLKPASALHTKPAPAPKPTPAVQAKPAASPRPVTHPAVAAADAVRSNLIVGVSKFMLSVAETAGVKVSMDGGKQHALSGELYLIDRAESSGYMSLYQAPLELGETERALALFRIRARKGGYNVEFPLAADSKLYEGIVDNDIKPFQDGKFKSIVNNCPPEGRRMDHIKRIVLAILKGEK